MSEPADTWVSDGGKPTIVFCDIGRCFYEYAKPLRAPKAGEYYLNPRNPGIAIRDDHDTKTKKRIVRPTHRAVMQVTHVRGEAVVVPPLKLRGA